MENTQEKYPNLISAKIVADSLNQFGERIVTLFLLLGKKKFCIFVEKLNYVHLQNNKLT